MMLLSLALVRARERHPCTLKMHSTSLLKQKGDKPERAYKEAADELAAMGYGSTLDYVAAAAGAVLARTGLLPHVNAGVMSAEDMAR